MQLNFPLDIKQVVHHRYADDWFLLSEGQSHLTEFLVCPKAQQLSVNFIIDVKKNNKLAFIEIKSLKNWVSLR